MIVRPFLEEALHQIELSTVSWMGVHPVLYKHNADDR